MSQELLIFLLYIGIPIIASLVSSVFAYIWPRFYAKLPKEMQQAVQDAARMAVLAVEQQFGDLPGEQKRQKAVELIVALLSSLKIRGISPLMINTALEAAVRAMNQLEKPKP